jgi:hypothetical protein
MSHAMDEGAVAKPVDADAVDGSRSICRSNLGFRGEATTSEEFRAVHSAVTVGSNMSGQANRFTGSASFGKSKRRYSSLDPMKVGSLK